MKFSTIFKAMMNPAHAFYSDSIIEYLVPKKRKHAALISAPKSGSTWLSSVLMSLLGWQVMHLLPHFGRREQELDIHRLLLTKRSNDIITPGVHTRYSRETTKLLKLGNAHTIIQVRSIFDIVVSFKDHMNRESVKWSMAYMDPDTWNSFNETEQLDFVVDMVVPWYFNFYCGWMNSDLIKAKDRALIVAYEDMNKDIFAVVSKVVKFLGEPKSDDEIRAAIEHSKRSQTRKNKGVIGRGKSQLNDEQRQRIIYYTRFYPNIDFTHLGIPDEMIPTRQTAAK
ncbi:MAG: sulfotransferase domain-containing protein [Opitutales bacterium]|jgi:hypothetical protein|nr:sulfotransferase domain-containing protein [Opitutales bacterium]